ncbi:MAG: hypothetical protein U1E94_07430 [Agitococcus sp.]
MRNTLILIGCVCASVGYAQDNLPSSTNNTPAQQENKVIVKKTPPTSSTSSNLKATTPSTTPSPVITPVAEFSAEQKLLIENATKLDSLNKELLVRNQQLQLTNEKISLQIEMLKHDRYSEGTRDTLVSIFVGILIGWFFTRSNKRSRYRDF